MHSFTCFLFICQNVLRLCCFNELNNLQSTGLKADRDISGKGGYKVKGHGKARHATIKYGRSEHICEMPTVCLTQWGDCMGWESWQPESEAQDFRGAQNGQGLLLFMPENQSLNSSPQMQFSRFQISGQRQKIAYQYHVWTYRRRQ